MRKALFIGGTGTISTAVTQLVAAQADWSLTLLNRGSRSDEVPHNVRVLRCDVNDEAAARALLGEERFDVVVDFIAFEPAQVQRDYRLFAGRCGQYIFISSASAYQKPLGHYCITESTPLSNPHWEYSRLKIACEEWLLERYRAEGFPLTIVRPSHTYGDRSIPLGVQGEKGSWQVARRMLAGKPVIIQGDGSSLWTMTHNTDFAKGFLGLMGNLHAIGEAVHITSDETLTWDQIYGAVADALGVPLRAVHISSEFLDACYPYGYPGLLGDKAVSVVFDNQKLKRLVPGFTATVRFDTGIRRTVEYVLAHPECQQADPDFDAWCDRVLAIRQAALEQLKR